MKQRECNVDVKQKIMDVALEEFAQLGYQATSTNVICKKAEVSKGLLYHYYGTKENLYLSSLRYVIDSFKYNVTIQIEVNSKKGIEYIGEFFNAKFKFFKDNPLYSKLIVNLLLNNKIEEAKLLANEFEEYNHNLLHEIIKNIDFNPKFDREKAFELIVMIGEKLEEKHMKNLEIKDKDTVAKEFRIEHKIMLEMVFEGIDKGGEYK